MPHPIDIPASELVYLPETTRPKNAPLPAELASTTVRPRTLAAHQEALRGPALDPLHLLLRSSVPDTALRHPDPKPVATLLKCEHDLAWSTGQASHDAQVEALLEEDLVLLSRGVPAHKGLAAAWKRVHAAIEDSLQPFARAA